MLSLEASNRPRNGLRRRALASWWLERTRLSSLTRTADPRLELLIGVPADSGTLRRLRSGMPAAPPAIEPDPSRAETGEAVDNEPSLNPLPWKWLRMIKVPALEPLIDIVHALSFWTAARQVSLSHSVSISSLTDDGRCSFSEISGVIPLAPTRSGEPGGLWTGVGIDPLYASSIRSTSS